MTSYKDFKKKQKEAASPSSGQSIAGSQSSRKITTSYEDFKTKQQSGSFVKTVTTEDIRQFQTGVTDYLSRLDQYDGSRKSYDERKQQSDALRRQAFQIAQYLDHGNSTDNEELRGYVDEATRALSDAQYQMYSSGQKTWPLLSYDVEAGRQELAEMDLAIEKLKLSALNNGLAAAYGGERSLGAAAQADRMELDALIQQRSDTARKVNRASHLQNKMSLGSVGDAADFDAYSSYQNTNLKDKTYEYINGKDNGNRQLLNGMEAFAEGAGSSESRYQLKGYDYLTDDEIGIYNYYYAKEGKDKAEEYLDSIQETLNERKARQDFTQLEDQTALELVFGVKAGLDQFESGVKSVFNTEGKYVPQSATQMVSGMVREDLKDAGGRLPAWLGGASLGQAAYDAVTTTANMAPSILASMATNFIVPGSGTMVGSALLGGSAAGNAYQEALNLGYDKGQAGAYALLIGASEAGLQSVLGGISALGGTGKWTAQWLNGIDNAFWRVAGKLGSNMLSEGMEEGLQEVLTPLFKQLALRTEEEINWSEAAYAALLGAITAGVMEGGGTYAADRATRTAGQQVLDAGQVQRLQEIGSTMSADSAAAQLAGKIDENTGAYTIGRLFHEVGASLTEQNKADIAASLESKGMDSEHAALHGEVMAYVVDGGQLSDVQMKMIEKNDILSKTLQEVLIDPNTTVYQRTTGYNQLLQELARKQSGAETTAAEETDGSPAPGSGQSQASQVKAREAQDQQAEQKTAYLKAGGTPVAIAGIASTEGGKLILRTEAGETVEAANVDLGSMGPVYEAVASMDVSPSEANLLVNSYQMNREMDPGEYALRMQSAYRFGKMGIPLVQAQTSEATNRLTDQQLQAIYGLGRAFAGKQASREQQQVKQRGPRQTLRNMAEGSDYVEVSKEVWQNLTEKQNDQIEAVRYVADALQVKIVIYASREREGRRDAPNGWYDPETDTIHLDIHAGLNGEGTMMFTLAHELTHRIRAWSPEKFKVLADFLMEQYGEKGVKVEALIDRKLDRVRKTYEDQKLTESQLYDRAFEEVVADSMEPMLTDGRVLQKLKARDQSIWEQLRDYIQELAQKIRKAYARLKPDSAEGQAVLRMKDSIEKIREKFLEGLEDSAANAAGGQKNTAPEGGGKMAASVRYSYAGINAADADLKGLAKAMDMIDAGKHPEEVRKETGWFRGADKKWRFEVDDSGMRYKNPEKTGMLYLSDVIDHEALFRQYPHLKAIRVQFQELPKDVSGRYSPRTNTIFLNDSLVSEQEDVLLHEIQHAIQQEEGFASGASVAYWQKQLDKGFDSRTSDIKEKERSVRASLDAIFLENTEFYEKIQRLMADSPTVPRGAIDWDTLEQIEEDPPEWKDFDSKRDALEEEYGSTEVLDLMDLFYWEEAYRKAEGRSAADLYYATAGEIEARDTERRRNLTAEQRRAKTPHTGNRDTVFVRSRVESNSESSSTLEDKYYARKIDQWDGKDHGGSFRVGKVSIPLLSVGIPDADIWFDQSKAAKQLSEKKEITKDVLKRIPSVLENPIAISESYDNTVMVFGQLFDEKGNPIVVALRINSTNRRNHITLVNKIRSVGTRTHNLNKLLAEENLLWLEENKKETRAWFNALGHSTPFGGTKSGFIRILSQTGSKSQGGYPNSLIRYQERDPGLNRVNEALRTEKEGLREDFDRTKAVFDLLNIREQEGIFTQGSLEAVAKGLKQKSGATGSTKELAGLLQEGFQSVIQMENPSWADVEEHLSPAVDWMMEHQKKHLDPRAQEALRHIRTSRVYLDKQQKGEAAYQYGSYNGYRKAAMGSIILTDKNSMSLDSWWHEMAEEFSDLGKFEKDLTSTDMPRRLLEIVKELRSLQTDMTFGIDTIGMEQDLLRQVYDGMIRAAVYPAQGGQLLSWQDQKLQDQKNENAAQVRKLMAKHQRQMQALKNSHEAEIKGLKKDFENRQAWQKASRERTELRHRIQRTVKQLSSMLTRETRTRHIPEVLKMAVVDALDAVNMDTVMAEERLKVLQEQLEKTSDPDARAEIEARIRTVTEMGGSMKKKLEALSAAYAAVRAEADPELSYAFDEEIGNQIQRVKDLVGSTPLRDMSKTQLEAVDELYTAVLTRVRDMNKAFATARQENIDGLGQAVIRQEMALKQRDARLGLTQPLRAFFWNNEKPVYAFQRIGSGTLTELYNNVRQGEDVYARDMAEAREFQAEMAKRFQKKDWDTKKAFPFHDRLGREFQLTLGQMMTLYAYSKREQAWDHLQYGGFQFAPDTQVLKRTKAGFEVAYNWSSAKTFKVDADILGDIISQLTDDQKAFADRMQSYLSDTMGAKGNEISMKLYGIRLFKERNYFPLKSSKAFLEQEKNKANGEVKIKNKGFTKQVQKYANNPVMLRSFDDIWADHVSDMSMYHGFTLPLEDFYRVRNYKEGIYDAQGLDAAQDSRSVVSAIQGAHGEEAVKYIEQLLKDLNGGAVGDPRGAIGKSLTSKHKKAAVMASLSVIAQQPTSIYRAMALVDARYFGADNLLIPTAIKTMNAKKHRESWAEVKQYAPVAIIKEMGSFDTNVGRSGRDYLNAPEYEGLKERTKAFFTDSNYRDEALGKAAAVADELAWVAIWNAVKKETADRHRGLLGQNKEEFMKLAGERFTEVITKTQVYDSVLARSANMRSKDAGVSMAMSFMAEPTTTANMVEDGIRKLLQGDRKTAGKIFRGVLASHIMNSAVVSLVYAMRDDDEDETFTEKYVSRLATELIEGMNPVTYIPYARDVWSVFQGYDVERADMTLVSDLAAAVSTRGKLLAKDTEEMDEQERKEYQKKVDDANWGMIGVLGSLAGVPIKNIRRDAEGVKNLFRTVSRGRNGQRTTYSSLVDEVLSEVQYSLPGGGTGKTSQEKLYGAIMAGDAAYAARLKDRYKSDSSYNTAVRKALRENDPRIRQAAQQRSSGQLSQYRNTMKAILAEKRFSQDDVVAAVNAEINAMSREETASGSAAKAKSLYTADDFRTALTQSGNAMAREIREEILRIAEVNGKTREEAEKSFASSARDTVKEGFLDGSLTGAKAEKALTEYGGRTAQQAKADVEYWAFKRDYPDIYADDSWFDKYYEAVEGSGLDIGTFMDYKNQVTDITGEGKKERRMAVIHALPITDEQKDALYFAEGWTESRLYEAPWH